MKREIITIADNGAIIVPNKVRMTISEIAELFGVYYKTAKQHIRTIEKSSVANGDYSLPCTGEGMKVYPEYYGLEMIVAVAFRVQSTRAEVFRRRVVAMCSQRDRQQILLQYNCSALTN